MRRGDSEEQIFSTRTKGKTMSDTTTQITSQPSTAGVPPTPPEAHQRADEGQGSGQKDFAAQLAFFLLEHTGSVFGIWVGKLSAAGPRDLFGRFIGKGKIVIDGERETLCNRVKVCFGLDWDDRNVTKWAAL
jgi:hypothetical protein